jgi:hypothetical protein
VVNGAIRIARDLHGTTIFDVNEDTTATVTHTAVAFNHMIVSVQIQLCGDALVSGFKHG